MGTKQMEKRRWKEELGDPDIKIGGLRIWIHGRESPDSKDYWDANWVNVTVECQAQGSSVFTSGTIIHMSEISHFLSGAEKIHKALKGVAEMPCMEPYLSVKLEAGELGHIKISVDITPDHLQQKHNFIFETDQSYLLGLISDCKVALEKYPLIGET
jgi:hypothetical protein